MRPPSLPTPVTPTPSLLSRRYAGGTRSYRDAQAFLAYSKAHREPTIHQLSLDAAYLRTGSCISLAIRMTSSCAWGHWRVHSLLLETTPGNSPGFSKQSSRLLQAICQAGFMYKKPSWWLSAGSRDRQVRLLLCDQHYFELRCKQGTFEGGPIPPKLAYRATAWVTST